MSASNQQPTILRNLYAKLENMEQELNKKAQYSDYPMSPTSPPPPVLTQNNSSAQTVNNANRNSVTVLSSPSNATVNSDINNGFNSLIDKLSKLNTNDHSRIPSVSSAFSNSTLGTSPQTLYQQDSDYNNAKHVSVKSDSSVSTRGRISYASTNNSSIDADYGVRSGNLKENNIKHMANYMNMESETYNINDRTYYPSATNPLNKINENMSTERENYASPKINYIRAVPTPPPINTLYMNSKYNNSNNGNTNRNIIPSLESEDEFSPISDGYRGSESGSYRSHPNNFYGHAVDPNNNGNGYYYDQEGNEILSGNGEDGLYYDHQEFNPKHQSDFTNKNTNEYYIQQRQNNFSKHHSDFANNNPTITPHGSYPSTTAMSLKNNNMNHLKNNSQSNMSFNTSLDLNATDVESYKSGSSVVNESISESKSAVTEIDMSFDPELVEGSKKKQRIMADLVNSTNFHKGGYLGNNNSIFKKKNFFYVLTTHRMYYFKEDKSDAECLGWYIIDKNSVVKNGNIYSGIKSLELETLKNGQKIKHQYEFEAKSKEEKEEWISAIKKVIQLHKYYKMSLPPVPPTPSLGNAMSPNPTPTDKSNHSFTEGGSGSSIKLNDEGLPVNSYTSTLNKCNHTTSSLPNHYPSPSITPSNPLSSSPGYAPSFVSSVGRTTSPASIHSYTAPFSPSQGSARSPPPSSPLPQYQGVAYIKHTGSTTSQNSSSNYHISQKVPSMYTAGSTRQAMNSNLSGSSPSNVSVYRQISSTSMNKPQSGGVPQIQSPTLSPSPTSSQNQNSAQPPPSFAYINIVQQNLPMNGANASSNPNNASLRSNIGSTASPRLNYYPRSPNQRPN